eukprot:jgi/Mesvir1/1885/Mv22915-RA.1
MSSATLAPAVTGLSSRVSLAGNAVAARARAAPVRTKKAFCVRASGNDNKFAGFKPQTGFFFPGQGAQSVGMAKEVTETVPAAKELFARANEVLGFDLLKLCIEGPAEKLNSTAISQPAIFVSSLAGLEKLKATEGGADIIAKCNVAAGLSLGEYTALTFAGALSFEDGLKLVQKRGESMQAAADMTPSAMASVVGLDVPKVNELCEAATKKVGDADGVVIANYLCPGNYAVSGGLKGIEALEGLAKEFGAKMTVRLAVAGAFHTRYMAPAREKLQLALADAKIKEPRLPVVSNVDMAAHSDPEVIRAILAKQLTSPVQWESTLKMLLDNGMVDAYEIGPNKVIAGIFKRINKTFPCNNITV